MIIRVKIKMLIQVVKPFISSFKGSGSKSRLREAKSGNELSLERSFLGLILIMQVLLFYLAVW